MFGLKSNSAPAGGAYRLIWSRPSGRDQVSEPMDRGEALAQFDRCTAIRKACHPYANQRLRVVADVEWHAAIRRVAEAALVAL